MNLRRLVFFIVLLLSIPSVFAIQNNALALQQPWETTKPIPVGVAYYLHDVDAYNANNETAGVIGVLTQRWQDPRLAFDPKVQGVSALHYVGDNAKYKLRHIWRPYLHVVNEVRHRDNVSQTLVISHDGTVTYQDFFAAVIKTKLDSITFPYGRHPITLKIRSTLYDHNRVRLQQLDQFVGNSGHASAPGLEVESSFKSYVRSAFSALINADVSTYYFSAYAYRNPLLFTLLLVVPLLLFGVLAVMVYVLPSFTYSDTTKVLMTLLLSSIAFQWLTYDLAALTPELTFVDFLSFFTFVTIILGFLLNVLTEYFDQLGWKKGVHAFIVVTRYLYPLFYIIWLLVLCLCFFVF